LSKYDIIYIN